jgi:hypothetical protein
MQYRPNGGSSILAHKESLLGGLSVEQFSQFFGEKRRLVENFEEVLIPDKFSMVLGKTGLCLGKPSVCQSSERPWLVPMSGNPCHNLAVILDVRREPSDTYGSSGHEMT